VQKLKVRHQKRQELAKPLAVYVSEQNFAVDNFEQQTVLSRNAA